MLFIWNSYNWIFSTAISDWNRNKLDRKIDMGISFFQIGVIDESKHALALSSKKVKEKNLSYEIVFFFLLNENKI